MDLPKIVKKMNKSFLKIIFVMVALFAANIIFAQTPPSRTPPPPPGIPLDGGILTLLAVAVGIAVKKIGFKNK